jgi:hypothetical protein
MIRNWEKERELALKRGVFSVFLENKREKIKERNKMAKMFRYFRKYHLAENFNRFKAKTSWETQIRDKSKIDGAYLLLKRFKHRLK